MYITSLIMLPAYPSSLALLFSPFRILLRPRVALSVVLPPKPYGYDPPNPAPGHDMKVWGNKRGISNSLQG